MRLDATTTTPSSTRRLAAHDAFLQARYPGERAGRQPVHTVYVPADQLDGLPRLGRAGAGRDGRALAAAVPGRAATGCGPSCAARADRGPAGRLRGRLRRPRRRPGGRGGHGAAAAVLLDGPRPPFVGIRIKSLEAATRRRALRTLDLFLSSYQDPFIITLPKVSGADQVAAMVTLCEKLERAYGLAAGTLRFEIQIELPSAVLGADGTATVARLITAAGGRCTGPALRHLRLQRGGRGRRRLPVDGPPGRRLRQGGHAGRRRADRGAAVRRLDQHPAGRRRGARSATAWELHYRLVRRSLERGFYQGWDLHPAQLPTRYAATYAFFRDGRDAAVTRLRRYLDRQDSGIADEPATARALAGYLLRGLDCGALDRRRLHPRGAGRRQPMSMARCRAAGTAVETAETQPRERPGRRLGSAPWSISWCGPAAPSRPAGERPAAVVGRRRDGSSPSRPTTRRSTPPRTSTSATSRCCPAWSTPTCTSTSRAAPSGRASPPPPGPPRPAGSPPSSTCR